LDVARIDEPAKTAALPSHAAKERHEDACLSEIFPVAAKIRPENNPVNWSEKGGV
jgi:hypothetical protein